MLITTPSVSISIAPDHVDYHYKASLNSEELKIETYEVGKNTSTEIIHFGSIEEMEAVAETILGAIKTFKHLESRK